MFRQLKRITIVACSLMMAANLGVIPVQAASAPRLNARSAIIMELETGKVLYKKNIHSRRAPASMTKLMTASIALEGDNPKKIVKISRKVAGIRYNVIKYRRGEKLYMRDLGYGSLLESDCGSTKAMAEGISGSTIKFVRLMNIKAKKLGCKDTHFVNTYGLDDRKHYSSAYDIALITKNAYGNKLIRRILKTKIHRYKTLNTKRTYTAYSTDELLGTIASCQGGKTGTTSRAGYCFSSIYKYHGKYYITVVMGCNKKPYRWKDTIKLYKYIKARAK